MKSPGFKALGQHQKVRNCKYTTYSSSCSQEAFKVLSVQNDAWLCLCLFGSSWTTSQEHSRSAERTGCGGTCRRCKLALANKSLAFSPGPLCFHRTLSCCARPGRTVAPGRNGSSSLYVTQVYISFTLKSFYLKFWHYSLKTFYWGQQEKKNAGWAGKKKKNYFSGLLQGQTELLDYGKNHNHNY